ncbi:MAG: cobalt ECF transporter T component CbiQ [Deltaproteobacteria bacterium]|nr:cobalt ECF transporter T component CbiQ [Deltaproteobacteria bacterium]
MPLNGMAPLALSRTDLLIEDYQSRVGRRGVGAWDPRLKLGLLVLAVALNVGLALPWLSVGLFLVAWGLGIWARIPLKLFAIFLVAPAWTVVMVVAGLAAGFGTTPLWTVGPLTFHQEGLMMGLSAAARVVSDMSWMAVVFLTTPFTRVLEALTWFRVPAVLVETVAMSYRYTFLLVEEFSRMRQAARSRGGFEKRAQSFSTTAMLLAEVILRAYDRARRIQEAMVARGAAAMGEASMSQTPAPADEYCPNRCDVTPDAPPDGGPLVQARGVSFSYPYPQRAVVEGVDLAVRPGEMVAVCGPNGSGKTTLLKLLAGILAPGAGEVRLCGEVLDKHSRDRAFHRVGILFQDPNDQLFCTHVAEDVAFGPRNQGLPPAEVERLTKTAMELLEVSHLAERPIHRLSHGEMKKVALAGLIAMRPPLILLDEPSAGLDPAGTRDLVRLINHLNEHHGYSFVTVTHRMDLAPLLARRLVVMREGRLVADGPARQVLSDAALLKRARLEPPLFTQLFEAMGGAAGQAPLNVEEAARWLGQMLGHAAEPAAPGPELI